MLSGWWVIWHQNFNSIQSFFTFCCVEEFDWKDLNFSKLTVQKNVVNNAWRHFHFLCYMFGSLGNHFLLSNDVVIERPTIGLDWHPLSISFFFSQQIKLSGMCCLISAVLCVVVTVSTTVIHMNRLQTLRECLYQGSTKTCTCFAGIIDPTLSHHEG